MRPSHSLFLLLCAAASLLALGACASSSTAVTKDTDKDKVRAPVKVQARPQARPGLSPKVCQSRQGDYGPVELSPEDAALRRFHGTRDIARVKSSKSRPVEVCHVQGELRWLSALRCPDGQAPFASSSDAHKSRAGNVGGGGLCGSIIDRYEVPCSDGNYEILIDMYLCAPGEWPAR